MEEIKKVGHIIKEARERKGLTQTELADLVGVTRGAINGLEADRSSPTVKTLQKVASALGVELKIALE